MIARPPGLEETRQAIARSGRATVWLSLEVPASGHASAPLARRKEVFRECQEACLRALDPSTYRLCYRYLYSPVLAIELRSPAALKALERLRTVKRLAIDQRGSGALRESAALVRAPAAHLLGLTGEGTICAVLDTGVQIDHPDLTDALLSDLAWHFLDQGEDTGPGADDGHGHGTNVTGIIASRGIVAPAGIAPGTKVVPIKVLDDSNSGWFIDWAAGLEYAVRLHEEDNGVEIDAINMSLASNAIHNGACDEAQTAISGALQAAVELGIAVFAASGNNGSTRAMALPACMTATVSVGSTLDVLPDRISSFTNRNSLLDLLAPGQTIVSSGRFSETSAFSGTSQATPHAAAAACLLRQADPALDPGAILAILRRSGVSVHDSKTGLSFPRLDVLAAIQQLEPPEISGLTCAYAPSTRQLESTWDRVEEADTLELTIHRDGQMVRSVFLDTLQTRFVMVGVPGGIYELCVAAYSSAHTGQAACCRVSVPAPDEPFRRGDCNSDAVYDVTDPIFTLGFLFLAQGSRSPCERACDANDDDQVDLSDGIYSLRYLFLGGREPPPPFASCGPDPTPLEPVLPCIDSGCG